MCLYSLEKTDKVKLHQLRWLVFENIDEFIDSKLILIEHVVKGECHQYFGNSGSDAIDVVPIIEEALKEMREKGEDSCLEVELSSHVPFEFEDALFDGRECILYQHLILIRACCKFYILYQNSQIGYDCIFWSFILELLELIVKLPVFHEKKETLFDPKSIAAVKPYQKLQSDSLHKDDYCGISVNRIFIIVVLSGSDISLDKFYNFFDELTKQTIITIFCTNDIEVSLEIVAID